MKIVDELLNHISGKPEVALIRLALLLGRNDEYDKIFYRFDGSLEQFLNLVENHEYDDGYGEQKLYGYIWYADGSWSERYEYDGAENWVHKTCPPTDIRILEI